MEEINYLTIMSRIPQTYWRLRIDNINHPVIHYPCTLCYYFLDMLIII